MRKKIFTLLGLLVLISLFTACGNQTQTEGVPTAFPAIHITTPTSPFVNRELWQDGTLSLTGCGSFDFEPVDARIRGRGNSTWLMGSDKRPLRFRFSEPRSMMGSEYAATDWILLANHLDQSLLRNYSALYFAQNMGTTMPYLPTIQNVHLYVNGEYMGLYLLTDERDVTRERMPLTWNADPSKSEYFIELCFRAYRSGIENQDFTQVNGRLYDVRFPRASRRTPEHVNYVQNYLYAVSYAIRSGDFYEITELIDLDTWVDFYIVQELFKNKDIYQASVFMSIQGQGDQRRLFMGPVWDFDLAAGNMRDQRSGTGPEGLYVSVINYWFRYLMQVSEFSSEVAERWRTLSANGVPMQMVARIQYLANEYQDDFELNFSRHRILGTVVGFNTPEIGQIDTFMGHMEFLVDWLETRIAWMDDWIGILFE